MAAPTNTNESLEGGLFAGFSPCKWRSLVSKRVEVISKDKKKHSGWVFTIDPVSRSIVLVEFPDEQRVVSEVIMGHAINTLTLVDESTPECTDRLNTLFRSSNQLEDLSEEEVLRRKTGLRQWLELHHIPVTLDGAKGELLSIAGALHIEPPYGLENCVSANEIILARIQALIRSKPEIPDLGALAEGRT